MKAIINKFEGDHAIVQSPDNNVQFNIPARLLLNDSKIGDWLDIKININGVSISELQYLNGIGPALSRRIVEYREQHGPFEHIEEIRNVQGMQAFGGDKFERIKNDITVGRNK